MAIHSLCSTVRVVLIVTALDLCACNFASDTARHSVDEYRRDPELRKARSFLCSNDPAGEGRTAECANVRAAERLETGSDTDGGYRSSPQDFPLPRP